MSISPTIRRGVVARDVILALVVVAAVLVVAVPFINRQRSQSRREACLARQAALALAQQTAEPELGRFVGYANEQAVDATGQRTPTGWLFPLFPYLARPEIYGVARAGSDPGDSPEIALLSATYNDYGPGGPDATRGESPTTYLAVLVCPATAVEDEVRSGARCSYVANTGMPDSTGPPEVPADWPANGSYFNRFDDQRPLAEMTLAYLDAHDGAAQTLLCSENVDAGSWTDHQEPLVGFVWRPEVVDGAPAPGSDLLAINELTGEGDGSYRFARPSSFHPGGVNVTYCDGHGDFLDEQVDYLVFCRMMTSNWPEARWPGTGAPLPAEYGAP
jgi:prepilin-type processing-associated H-X9-DG protein